MLPASRGSLTDYQTNSLTPASPLAIFRIGFGLLMLLSVVRFWYNGWIGKLYLEPTYFFSYQYFEWVKPLGNWTYGLFALTGISAIGILLGYKYRLSAVLFFLGFTYIELMDKTTYLNHYYFVSLLAFVMIWLPAADYFSLDHPRARNVTVPRWTIDCLKIFVAVVYFYAGLAKLNSDWLLHAQPLATWLPAKYSLPLLGDLLQERWVHFAFAWSGAAYDLLIPFLLLWKPTRTFAFLLVVVFHVLTRVLFPIGMFPYIMIVSALLFFDAHVYERIIDFLRGLLPRLQHLQRAAAHLTTKPQGHKTISPRPQVRWKVFISKAMVSIVLLLHLLLPWRYLLHDGELFWTEEGYRFSWRVMLMEKAGYTAFTLVDPDSGKRRTINTREYLSTFQEKQMATQPDFILEFAHHIASVHQRKGRPLPAVFVESFVALNGRGSRPYVDPTVDLTQITQDTPRSLWLMPFEEVIYGL